MKVTSILAVALAAGMGAFASAANANPVNGTGNVTYEVIYGSGNANGSYTGDTSNGVEVGLRAHVRYGSGGQPQNTFNYDGDHTYTFDSTLFTAPAGRSGWNFDWSVNTDPTGTTGKTISDYTYQLTVTGPGGVYRTPFDPYDGSTKVGPDDFYDHSFGNNGTANSAGVEATNSTEFATYKGTYNLSQQSWNLGFEDLLTLAMVQSTGLFTITLDVIDGGNTIASASINVDIEPTPLPAALPLFASGLGALGFAGWRRRRKRAATA